MSDAEQACEHCGAALGMARILELDEEGDQRLLCESCAMEMGTGTD